MCYSCQKYKDCNVKTGTCQKCDQYINKAEAEKTDEQRYSEEQDAIDRQTKKKLQERVDAEKMQHLPSEGNIEHKGRNDLIKLELWQKAIVSVIFGIQDAEKIRIFREIFIVIGRKNGKSLFASAIIAYMAYLEPEYGQEIYCLAPKLDQAALVYDGFYQMVQAEDELAELAKKRRSDIYIAESNTVIKPIQIDARITEVTETYQKGEETIEATFGDSLPTLVDQIRKVR